MNAEGTTVFITTHQIEEANQLCGRVAIISHGKIAAIDTPERLKANFRRTQSVEVAFEGDVTEKSLVLETLPGVTTQTKVGDKIRLYTEDPSALLPRIIQFAESHTLRVVSLNTLSPSLEDVFLEITGGQMGTVRNESLEEKPARRGKGARK
jgi:ABC-2 type transport system ATP-binding protein